MDDRTFTVSELAEIIRSGLDQMFPHGVWVEGEISSLSRRRNGHVYFELVEPADDIGQTAVATVPVVLFREARERVNRLLTRHGNPIRMADGVKIRIQGMVDFYPPTGRLQVRMTAIDPTYTLGRLATERDALLARLAADQLLRSNASRSVPPVPLRVGLVTSLGSAAHADVVTVLERSRFAFTLVEADAAVQGTGAENQIAGAIAVLAAAGVDVLILARGGGSRTDLATFDHELVARAIATAPVPVFTGLGHDIDRSVADEVAHTAHTTPTAAAQHVVGLVGDWLIRLDELSAAVAHHGRRGLDAAERRVTDTARACLRSSRHGIDRVEARVAHNRALVIASGRARVRAAQTRVRTGATALARRGPQGLTRSDRDLDALATRVRALDPARALARGWSITRATDDRIVRSVGDVAVGDRITTQLADGSLTSTIRGATEQRDPA